MKKHIKHIAMAATLMGVGISTATAQELRTHKGRCRVARHKRFAVGGVGAQTAHRVFDGVGQHTHSRPRGCQNHRCIKIAMLALHKALESLVEREEFRTKEFEKMLRDDTREALEKLVQSIDKFYEG